MQKVIVAFENSTNSVRLKEILELDSGLHCLVCRNASEVKRVVRKQRLRTIVCGFKLPDESCEELYHDLPDGCSMLMIGPQARLELCQTEGIYKLQSPVHRGDLLASVRMLLQIRHVPKEERPAKRSEKEQEIMAQAKALLMDRHGMTEEEAHRFLQKQSMNSGAKLADTARLVLSGQ